MIIFIAHIQPFYGIERGTTYYDFGMRLLHLMNAITISFSFLFLCLKSEDRTPSKISQWGQESLFFYIYHPYVLLLVTNLLLALMGKYIINAISGMVITIITVALLLIFKQVPLLKRLLL